MTTGKVLIVDDIPENLQVLGQILDSAGFEVIYAMEGQQAVESAKFELPDLILMDVNMPVMDGYTATRILKEEEETRHIPVIFLTAKTETDDIIKGFDIGAVDYVTKPFQAKELLSRVSTHLELKKSREELEKMIEEKNKFFSIIAHDMKTPFNALIGFSNLLVMGHDISTDDKESFIRIINETSKQGLGLLENLLLWARSQTGRMEINPEKISINSIIQSVINLLHASAMHKQIQLSSMVRDDIYAYADYQSINTVFRNLISNAIKFTPKKGNIMIQAEQDGAQILVSVNDNGLGMTPDKVKQLFRYDKKVSTKGTNNETGTGLGLLLVKEFVEQNGGKISVESKEGEGTTFTVALPQY
mgnify:CR=1 FL=1